MSFGERLKELREYQGLQAKDVARAIGVAASTLSGYESGRREPDAQTLIKLSRYFGVSIDYLLVGMEPGQNPDWPELDKKDIAVFARMRRELTDEDWEEIQAIWKIKMARKINRGSP